MKTCVGWMCLAWRILPLNDQDMVYTEFKEQLRRDPGSWYETGLPWKGNHPPLPSNKQGSIQRLDSLMRKLNRMSNTCTEEYNKIIQDQKQSITHTFRQLV